MIEEKARLVRLLDDYMGGDGLTVVIGSEHHVEPTCSASAWSSSTYSDGRGTGAVGVIGPTRMRYSRAINAVDSLSRSRSAGSLARRPEHILDLGHHERQQRTIHT